MSAELDVIEKDKFKEIAFNWDQAHYYSPAPRHRRKIILNLIQNLKFDDCLDTGCAQPYLLNEIQKQFNVQCYGCDISKKVISDNKKRFPHFCFEAIDLEMGAWPNEKQFDLVISSEVIEHIEDWQSALANLTKMTKRYLLITVPSGSVEKIDRIVGHHRHFNGDELLSSLKDLNFSCLRIIRHGFPMHSLYKRLINDIAAEKVYDMFQNKGKYSFFQKIFSQGIYYLFYLNYFFSSGKQLFILAERI